MVIEILFIQIRADKNIKGFIIDNIEILLSAFADDTTFIIKDIHSVNRILKHMKDYEVFSSLRVNVDKSEACWIGKVKGRTDKPLKCRWVCLQTDVVKILGIYFSYDKQIANKMNFIKLIIDSRALLNIWNQWWLSLYGKMQIFKSLIVSKPVFLATMNKVPEDFINALQSMHKTFIWNNKTFKVKHSILIGDYTHGGLRDIDIRSKLLSLKFSWFKRMMDENNPHPWKVLANEILKEIGCLDVFHTNLALPESLYSNSYQLPLFYKELITLWQKFSDVPCDDAELILSQYLWYNKYVLKENKPFILPVFLGRGIKCFCNLIGPDGYFKNWEVTQLEFDLEANNLLDWHGIVKSIPNAWKNRIKSMQTVHLQDIPSYYNCFLVGQKYIKPSSLSSSMIYEACIKKVFKPPTSRRYFERIFGVMEEEEWRNIYTLTAKVTVCTSLRIFQ